MRLKRYWLVTVLLFALALSLGLPAQAQGADYLFQLLRENVDVYINNNGSVTLDYTFVFENSKYGHKIDYVDVGLPNNRFEKASATVDGQSVPVSASEYAGDGSGVAVVLGSHAILPGRTGTVRVVITGIEDVFYQDNNDENYASFVFSPTWFGSQYVQGKTELTVTFHLPVGIQPQEPRYHLPSKNWPGSEEPQIGRDANQRVTYTWYTPEASGSTQYKFGTSFPSAYLPAGVVQVPTFWERMGIDEASAIGILATCVPLAFIVLSIVVSVKFEQKRLMKYVPPKIGITGHGIKRGLTAVEAAILLEQPLDRVLTMILFGLLQKGAATVIQREPLTLQPVNPLPENLRSYEKAFLEVMQIDNKRKRAEKMEALIIALVKSVEEKMRGFSRRETAAYYRKIAQRAWQQVQAANTPEVKMEKFDEYMQWTMLDPDFDDRTRRTFTGNVPAPRWWGYYAGTGGRASSGRGSSQASGPSLGPTRTVLPGAAFADSIVKSINQTASDAVGDVRSFTANITKTTNPVPVRSSSRSSGGGGGCACACACAGCACACAGGGR